MNYKQELDNLIKLLQESLETDKLTIGLYSASMIHHRIKQLIQAQERRGTNAN